MSFISLFLEAHASLVLTLSLTPSVFCLSVTLFQIWQFVQYLVKLSNLSYCYKLSQLTLVVTSIHTLSQVVTSCYKLLKSNSKLSQMGKSCQKSSKAVKSCQQSSQVLTNLHKLSQVKTTHHKPSKVDASCITSIQVAKYIVEAYVLILVPCSTSFCTGSLFSSGWM